ncbi:MAG: YgjV family protein [Clostridia bacterium]|nr:YgjV family protein [Clostridia bacterium]
MVEIIIGNICSVLGMASDSFSSTRKTNRSMLLVQIISQVFYGTGSFVLKGYSAVVQNAVTVARNLIALKGKTNRIIEWIMILAGVFLGVAFNNRGLMGYLPIVANLEYSISVFYVKSERGLKVSFMVSSAMFSVFNLLLQNYVGFVTNIVVAVITLVAILRHGKKGERNGTVRDADATGMADEGPEERMTGGSDGPKK